MRRIHPVTALSAVVEAARRRHATALRSYVAELVAGDRARVDAVLEETWTALGALPDAEMGPRLGEWIFAEARRRAMAGPRGAVAADDRTGDDDRSPEAIFDRLTPKQQEVLHLRFGPQFPHEQIAAIVELSPAHVAQLLHVALGRLAPVFRETGASNTRGGRHDDPRLTLAALDELDGEARRAWEAGWTDTADTMARLEETRRASRWVANHLASAQRRRRRGGKVGSGASRTRRWTLLVAVGVSLAAAIGYVAWGRNRGRDETQERRLESSEKAGPRRKTPRAARDVVVARGDGPTAAPAGAETRTLGVFRERMEAGGHQSPRQEVDLRQEEVVAVPRTAGAAAAAGVADLGATAGAGGAMRPAASTMDVKQATAVAAPVMSTDTAAIVALKRALGQGRWPKPEEVDRAKLQAYFAARARPASRAVLFEKKFEAAPAPWAPGKTLVRAVAQAPDEPPSTRPRANVILLLDVSGSMDAPNRLPLVQEAVRGLVDRLRPDDRVGLVTYAGESRVLLAPAELKAPASLRAAVMGLEARGRTNGGAGLAEAFALARSDGPTEHLVVLCTDGEFNMGASSEEELAALVRAQSKDGVRLAIFGFGRAGQIDPRLEQLAALGRGGSGYVNTRADAVRVLLGQLDELIAPVAREAWLSVAAEGEGELAPPRVARADALLPGDTLTIMTEMDGGTAHVRARLDYTLVRNGEARTEPWRGRVAPVEFAATSAEFRFAAAVARFAELLTGPREQALRELDALEIWARDAVDDEGGYRAEFLTLVAQARAAQ